MAVTKQMHMKQCRKGAKSTHLKNAIAYILRPDKTEDGLYTGAINCIPVAGPAYRMMMDTKKQWGKPSGRQGYHYVLSFASGETTPEQAYEIVEKFAKEYLGGRYEAVFAIHTDTDVVHGHIVFNSVSCMDGYKYHAPKGEWEHRLQPLANRLCEEYGLSTLSLSERRQEKSVKNPAYGRAGSGYGSSVSSQSAMLRRDIDECIGSSTDFDEFLQHMKQRGFEINLNRKHPTLWHEGMDRNRRFGTLGKKYSIDTIKERIAAGERPVPEKGPLGVLPSYRPDALFVEEIRLSMYACIRISEEAYSRIFRQTRATAAIRDFYRLKDGYDFLVKHGIHSRESLNHLQESSQKKLQQQKEAWKAAKQFRKQNQEVMDLANAYLELQPAAMAYLTGEEEFYSEYMERMRIEDRLKAHGYTPDEAVALSRKLENSEESCFHQIKELQKIIKQCDTVRELTEDRTPDTLQNRDIAKVTQDTQKSNGPNGPERK